LDPKVEAYQPCKTAQVLYVEERAALAGYLATGGTLPAQEPKRRIV
jgi:hypothetical protein